MKRSVVGRNPKELSRSQYPNKPTSAKANVFRPSFRVNRSVGFSPRLTLISQSDLVRAIRERQTKAKLAKKGNRPAPGIPPRMKPYRNAPVKKIIPATSHKRLLKVSRYLICLIA